MYTVYNVIDNYWLENNIDTIELITTNKHQQVVQFFCNLVKGGNNKH